MNITQKMEQIFEDQYPLLLQRATDILKKMAQANDHTVIYHLYDQDQCDDIYDGLIDISNVMTEGTQWPPTPELTDKETDVWIEAAQNVDRPTLVTMFKNIKQFGL